ncbi:Spy0128 family protein [Bifidobacterium oedipodis]|uniref:Spy0128 family protein n=1 Tax=Bifidobacterium oedipodis TaxID=2675322 RepID=UPI00145DD289
MTGESVKTCEIIRSPPPLLACRELGKKITGFVAGFAMLATGGIVATAAAAEPQSNETPQTATVVKTVDEFKKAIAAQSNLITVDGDFELDDMVVLPQQSDITVGGKGTIQFGTTGGIKVPDDASLIIDSDKLVWDGGNGGGTEAAAHAVPMIWSQGKLKLKAGIIQNFTGGNPSVNDAYLSLTGINAVYIDGTGDGQSEFIMDGGSIEKNTTAGTNYGGGGVKLAGDKAVMTMNGGKISGNHATRNDTSDGIFGGGVMLFNGGTFTMNDGEITNNVAGSMDFQQDALGGGVAAIGMGSKAHVVLNGGFISGNKALSAIGGHGGGVMVHTEATFEAQGGSISNNETTGMGGGLYVDGLATDGVSNNKFYNTVITGNTATNLGGGLWICPTGRGSLSVTKGAAIYDNSAPNDSDSSASTAAGDDFVAHPRKGDAKYPVTLASRMLGGGKATWYQDGGLLPNLTNDDGSYSRPNPQANAEVPRYDAENPGEAVVLENDEQARALKNVTTGGAKALANKLGKVVISGNKAKVGGGVATNSMISFGGDDEGEDIDYSLTVTKQWDDAIAEADRKDVSIDLKIGNNLIDSAKLSANNEWTATFDHLPAPDGYDANGTPYLSDKDGEHLKFQIVESSSGYEVEYGAWTHDADKHTLTTSLINKLPVNASLTVQGLKTVDGEKPDSTDFKFKLVPGNDATKQAITDGSIVLPDSAVDGSVMYTGNDSEGKFAFDAITFTKPGSYQFLVTEPADMVPDGYVGDAAVYTVGVTVDDSMQASIAYLTKQVGKVITQLTGENMVIRFDNTTSTTPPTPTPTPQDATLTVKKVIEGCDKNGSFDVTTSVPYAGVNDTVSLGDGDSKDYTIHFQDPNGAFAYTVQEADPGNGYQVSVSDGTSTVDGTAFSGSIKPGQHVTVTVTNKGEDCPVPPEPTPDPDPEPEPEPKPEPEPEPTPTPEPKPVPVPNTGNKPKPELSKTGVAIAGVAGAVVLLLIAGIALTVVRQRRNQ